MVKVKIGKRGFVPSEYVSKELNSIKKRTTRKEAVAAAAAAADALKAQKIQDGQVILPETRRSDDLPIKRGRWRNKQRVLIFGTRGIIFRGRHIMENLRRLMPHSKKEAKMDKRDNFYAVNEICEMKNCNKCLFFEGRRQGDIYMWLSIPDEGPSFKFLMENVSTMEELKFTGNCLKGSRAILSFDPTFDTEPHYQLMKEAFVQVFGSPYHHPKSQPFIDHVFTFTILDNRIWFRNFQIIEEDGSLVEIGPRFTLNPIRIFAGSFNGTTLWNNIHYKSPVKYRSELRKATAGKYLNKVQQKIEYAKSKPKNSYKLDKTDEIFQIDPETMNNGD